MTSTSATTVERDEGHQEGVKDTIESVVIALILAFIFRAFVVEAFVIPTGSMAPTLYGAHGTIICEDCGTEFAYGLRDLDDHRRTTAVTASHKAICPNCNHPNTHLKTNDFSQNPETGDRILVLKWPYDIGGSALDPARWDVVVFKDPADGKTNFIKRLIGQPNEVLTILDGDVYGVSTHELSKYAMRTLEQLRRQKREFREGTRRGHLPPIPDQLRKELDAKLAIWPKTAKAQQSLWFVVYDHNYPPQTLDPGQPWWKPLLGEESGWQTASRRVRYQDRGETNDGIELAGKEIRASCAYNIRHSLAPPVSDQRVRFVLTPADGTATVRIRLEKLGRAFWATVRMDGTVTLTESKWPPKADAPPLLSRTLPPFQVGEPVTVSFENVDYRLALSIAGEEVLATSTDRNGPAYYGPDLSLLRKLIWQNERPAVPPKIYGDGGDFELNHLIVERDAYYYHGARARTFTLNWAPPQGWASPDYPIWLRGNEYFMLGDNTAASKDSRLWDTAATHLKARGDAFQLGTVPKDQLIGKAFFVYWPSPTRIDWLEWIPVVGGNLVPDVGRMRWIR